MVNEVLQAFNRYTELATRINECPICSERYGVSLPTINTITEENLKLLAQSDLEAILNWLNDIEANAMQRLRSVRALVSEQTWNDYQYMWDEIKGCRECTLLRDALDFAKLYLRQNRHPLTYVKNMQQRIREVRRESKS